MRAAHLAARMCGRIEYEMQRNPVPNAPGSPPLPRPLSLYEILAVILLWHVTVPAVFGAIGSLFGLAPVFWASSVARVGQLYGPRPQEGVT